MNKIEIKVEIVNAMLQYLGSRPYAEVYQLIAAIQEAAKEEKQEEIN